MKKKLSTVLATGIFFLGMVGIAIAVPVQWTTGVGANGHWYDIIDSNISWTEARATAESVGGYLATITTSAEQQFVASLIAAHVKGFNTTSGYMIGGFQPVGSSEPNGNWQWVTSEAWNYANWGSGEPNNVGTENYLYMDERYAWAWNDYTNVNYYYGQPSGYIVETAPVPEPATMFLLGTGMVGIICRRKIKK